MKLVVFVAAVCAAACGGGGGSSTPDAGPTGKGDPTGFTFTAIGERSFASFGWMGTFHDLEVPDGTPFSVKVSSCDADGRCQFTGPVKPPGAVNRQRCLNHMSKTCTADADCVEGAPTSNTKCVFIYDSPTGTPIAGAGGAIGACGFSYIPVGTANAPTIHGYVNVQTGELNIQDMNIVIALNGPSGGYRGACAECIGDGNPNDGMAEGTCKVGTTAGANEAGSPDLGKKCDVHRFGNVTGYDKSYSMDCAPTVQAGDQQNAFGGQFTSSGYRVATTAASPNCTAVGFESQKCLCGMCPDHSADGVPQKACFTDADCGGEKCGAIPAGCEVNPMPFDENGNPSAGFDPMRAPNQCKTGGPVNWFAAAPNSCMAPGCVWDKAKGTGHCTSRLTKKVVGCYPEKENAAVIAPGGSEKRGDVFIVDTAAARCTRSFTIPPGAPQAVVTATSSANSGLGLPGLTFQRRAFRVIPEYVSK
jgi:hypothetical protein